MLKVLVAALFLSSFAIAANNGQKRILPVTKEQEQIKKDKVAQEKLKALGIKEDEDCDEKAKKPVEIKPESISLTGNAGCTLDEAH